MTKKTLKLSIVALLIMASCTKEDVVDRVLKERFLKKNTILVNLQNAKYFKKLDDGRYTVAK